MQLISTSPRAFSDLLRFGNIILFGHFPSKSPHPPRLSSARQRCALFFLAYRSDWGAVAGRVHGVRVCFLSPTCLFLLAGGVGLSLERGQGGSGHVVRRGTGPTICRRRPSHDTPHFPRKDKPFVEQRALVGSRPISRHAP